LAGDSTITSFKANSPKRLRRNGAVCADCSFTYI
jgi:hypothetical protein